MLICLFLFHVHIRPSYRLLLFGASPHTEAVRSAYVGTYLFIHTHISHRESVNRHSRMGYMRTSVTLAQPTL
jgi:hypothetical protein